MAMLALNRPDPLSLVTVLLGGTVAISLALAGCNKAPGPATSVPEPAAVQAVAPPSKVPRIKRHIYDESSDPVKTVADALKEAKRKHKRVILDFGGDWCGDCQVLDIYYEETPNKQLLAENFVVARIFVNTRFDNPVVNRIGDKYGVPLRKKGVPALAVLDANGKPVFSQKNGEFESMRHMDAQSVTDFLTQWKP
jgi:thiol:disulfide interchange protein